MITSLTVLANLVAAHHVRLLVLDTNEEEVSIDEALEMELSDILT